MKNFQQNLLILLALSLCGLCAWQWYFETVQRGRVERLNQTVYENAAAAQGYTNSLRQADEQIAQMNQQITALRAAAETNGEVILDQKRGLARLESSNGILTNQIAQYKTAVSNLESKLQESYDGIAKQNKAVEALVAQRDEFVLKFNDSAKARNDLISQYNQLVERLEKLQPTQHVR